MVKHVTELAWRYPRLTLAPRRGPHRSRRRPTREVITAEEYQRLQRVLRFAQDVTTSPWQYLWPEDIAACWLHFNEQGKQGAEVDPTKTCLRQPSELKYLRSIDVVLARAMRGDISIREAAARWFQLFLDLGVALPDPASI